MWKFLDEEKVRYFKMERLVMGNMPSAGLSGTALSETAKLDDYPVRYPHAHKALTEDNYVDNVFLTASDHEKINTKIAEIEAVAAKGGFFFKPFMKYLFYRSSCIFNKTQHVLFHKEVYNK